MLRARFLHLITCHVPGPGIEPATSGMLSGRANHYTTASHTHTHTHCVSRRGCTYSIDKYHLHIHAHNNSPIASRVSWRVVFNFSQFESR